MSDKQKSWSDQGMEWNFFRASSKDFKKIPGKPIAYWISNTLRDSFQKQKPLSEYFFSDGLTKTGSNETYLRFHWEIDTLKANDKNNYRICVKGGDARDFYGNVDVAINWTSAARAHYKTDIVARITPEYLWETTGISWTKISSKGPTFRWFGDGMIAETGGPAIFAKAENSANIYWQALGFLASKVSWNILTTINPTLNFQTNDVLSLPFNPNSTIAAAVNTKELTNISKSDWDSYETSWGFTKPLLLNNNGHALPSLKARYQKLCTDWRRMILEMQRLEQENNRIFIDAYGLQDELTPEVPLSEITLTCNPHYRYGGDKSEEELEALLLADTMRELVSYAVGCMLGRYSLDKPGLILANQDETLADYLAQVPQPSFPADDDNVIPVLDGDWFADDITLRFRQFLRVAFGEEHYDENLAFIEQSLNVKGKRDYSLRDYFLSEFYADHVKRYKKRPIYWLFSSPKGSFNALIYMHRYRPDTVSVVLKYLRDYREKLSTERERQASVSINPATSQGDKTRALKEVDRLAKVLTELEDYERDVLYPKATEQIAIDLDDGVKVNYLKFGAALKKIVGLDAKEED